ncbi:MAG: DUF456 domain-containing protein [Verrucomicrobiota bacterium]
MTAEQIIGLSVALLIMGCALIGNLIPALPGTPLALAAAVVHRLYFGEASASITVMVVLIILTAVSVIVDFAATALGARKFGATWRGMLGAVLGGAIGLVFGLPGIIAGPFLGATLFELVGDKQLKAAAKAGAGAVIGLLLGAVGKSAICVIMMALFATNVIYRSLH